MEAKKRQLRKPSYVSALMHEQKARSDEQVGTQYNVSRRYVSEAKRISIESPEIFEQVKIGDKTITEVVKERKIEARKQQIAQMREDIEKGTLELPEGKFEVIVIDPAWDYGTDKSYNPDGFRGTAPYPTMSLQEIKAIKIPASDDCILWLWTTHKFIRHSFDLLDAWGFRDVSILTWVKNKMGIGKWLRSKSEYCIMAVKGKPLINLTNQTTVLMADAKGHSTKPTEFYDMVDKLCVGRKLDYFARKKREGWDIFGDIGE